jgi:hypothetical protein
MRHLKNHGEALLMTIRWKLMVTTSVATCTIIAGCAGGRIAFAQSAQHIAAAAATGTSTPIAHGASGSPTPTRIPVKPMVHNPTPIAGYLKHVTLPKPIVLEVGTKTQGVGLSQTKALFLANSYVPQMFIVAPTYIPKNYALQLIHVDPAQDQQTPPAMYLQYVPKGLKNARGTYPSFYVNKQVGNSTVIYPGVKSQVVTINRGKKGIGVVKGTLVDLKPKNGYETVHILWTRVTISYDLSSNIGVSKLSIKDLLAVAATVQ